MPQNVWTDNAGNLFTGESGTTPLATSAEVASFAGELLNLEATEFDALDMPGGQAAAELLRKVKAVAGSALAQREGRVGRLAERLSDAEIAILYERQRQVEVEGWTPEHDDAHDGEELAKAAGCYALGTTRAYNHRGQRIGASFWPWDIRWWKPGPDRRRDLVKAGALIVAEIERLDRAETRNAVEPD